MCHHLLYVRQGSACFGQNRRERPAVRHRLEAHSQRAQVWNCLYHSLLPGGHRPQRCAGRASGPVHRGVSHGGLREENGRSGGTRRGAAGRHSLRDLRPGGYDGAEPRHVPAGKADFRGLRNPSVHRRRQPAFRCGGAGHYDPAHRHQRQRFLPPGSARFSAGRFPGPGRQ